MKVSSRIVKEVFSIRHITLQHHIVLDDIFSKMRISHLKNLFSLEIHYL
jgi:hypothetical protein